MKRKIVGIVVVTLLIATGVLPVIGTMNNIGIRNVELNDLTRIDMSCGINSPGPDGYSDDVGFYRPSTGMWYYDYDHDGDTNGKSGPWGNPGDLPIAGQFGGGSFQNDVGIFRPSTSMWSIDLGHDGDTDFWIGPWGWEDDIPFAGLYNFIDGKDFIGVFRASEKKWYYDVDLDGETESTTGPWGEPGDLPFAGDFNNDGLNNDIGIFRPSTQMWSYNYNRDIDTDERSGPWGESGDLPFVGDFDNDGKNDDVGVFRPSTGMWYYDYDHNGNTDDTSGPWGESGDLPFVGDLDRENYEPYKPSKPEGDTSGKSGKYHQYTTSTTDPDGDQVTYYWDWGDEESWVGSWYDSGDTCYRQHAWFEEGTYDIRVYAKDEWGLESEWSDPLSVTMPKTKIIDTKNKNNGEIDSMMFCDILIKGSASVQVIRGFFILGFGKCLYMKIDLENDGLLEISSITNPSNSVELKGSYQIHLIGFNGYFSDILKTRIDGKALLAIWG